MGKYIIDGKKAGKEYTRVAPKNGIQLTFEKDPVAIVTKTVLSRNMTQLIRGSPSKAYMFPASVTNVWGFAFDYEA